MFKTQFSKNRNKFDDALECSGHDGVVQHLDEFCNIKHIYEMYSAGEKVSRVQVTYSDMPAIDDFRSAYDLMNGVNTYFNSLPAEIRNKFDGKAEEFLSAVGKCGNDTTQLQKMLNLGVEVQLPNPAPVEASAVSRPQSAEVTQKIEE